jgi:hypothetical protein
MQVMLVILMISGAIIDRLPFDNYDKCLAAAKVMNEAVLPPTKEVIRQSMRANDADAVVRYDCVMDIRPSS